MCALCGKRPHAWKVLNKNTLMAVLMCDECRYSIPADVKPSILVTRWTWMEMVVEEQKDKTIKCPSCDGKGKIQRQKSIINGTVLRTVTYKCFRCIGKGYQNIYDMNRNATYDEMKNRVTRK